MHAWEYAIWLLGAYLIGSVPFGLLLGRLQGIDIRQHGSGNVGASNVGRVLGRKTGLLCFALDVGKGLGPVLAYGLLTDAMRLVRGTGQTVTAVILDGEPTVLAEGGDAGTMAALLWLGMAAAAVLGHVFPVWLRFKGGKGVATGLGVLLGVFPYLAVPGILGLAAWAVTVKLTGYVSLASVVAAALLPALTAASATTLGLPVGPTLVFVLLTFAMACLVIFRHWTNLQRIRAGTEPKAAWAKRQSNS